MRCQACRIKERGANDPVVMTCVCHGKGKKINKNAEINLCEFLTLSYQIPYCHLKILICE